MFISIVAFSALMIMATSILLGFILLFSIPSTYAQPSQDLEAYEVTYEENTFEVRAAMSNNAGIDDIEVFPEFGSILLTLGEGSQIAENELTIVLPRGLIDSNEDGADSDFLIIVDGLDVEYEEIQTAGTARTLRFNLPSDAIEVEIFGSQVIPEFPFGIIITLSATIGAILLIHRTRRFF